MDPSKLAYMADQIARNFAALGHDEAVAATAEHIGLFWDPRMKAAIVAADASVLSPIAAQAVQRISTARA